MPAKQAPGFAFPLQQTLDDLVARQRENHDGTVATYIPELGKADPNAFGIAIVTADGAVYASGDADVPFTIQSISKPLVYALALKLAGSERLAKIVGVEPSGEAFNSISLRPGTGTPLNPMINAGAIAVANLVHQESAPSPLATLLGWFGDFAGRPLEIDDAVYRSERETGHRNRAIAHLLRNFEVVRDPVEEGLDLYFQQCSILVTCRDLAMMAATLANMGVHPVSGRSVLEPRYVDDVLSVMTTCGMYDYAGQWLYDVGLPAKSGVAGGIMAVLPGRMGIGLFSPRLDAQGNSVRGIAACRALSERYGLHLFGAQRSARSTIRRTMTLAQRHSARVRSLEESRSLGAIGSAAVLIELQGDLDFTGFEVVQRLGGGLDEQVRVVLFDLARIDSVHPAAAEGLAALVAGLHASGRQVAFAAVPRSGRVPEDLVARCAPTEVFPDLDSALEACEQLLMHGTRLTREARDAAEFGSTVPLRWDQLELAGDFTPPELEILAEYGRPQDHAPQQAIFRRGDPATSIYFLARGRVSVRLPGGDGAPYQRLATFSPGQVFGEMSVIDAKPRSADVWTECPVRCYALPLDAMDHLSTTHPQIKLKIYQYLLRILSSRLRKANEQIEHLAH